MSRLTGRLRRRIVAVGALGLALATSVAIAPNPVEAVTVDGFGDLDVTVLDQNGQPVPDGFVSTVEVVQTGAISGGSAGLRYLPSGPISLSATDAFGFEIGSAGATVVANATTPVVINTTVPTRNDSLELTVVDGGGQPVVGVEVRSSSNVATSAITDNLGVAVLDDIANGTETISLVTDVDGRRFTLDTDTIVVAGSPPISPTATVTLEDPGFGQLDIDVEDALGQPVTTGRVYIAPAGDTDMTGLSSSPPVAGYFAPAVPVTVSVRDDLNNLIGTSNVTVVNGVTTPVTVTVTDPPTATVIVNVEDLVGDPVDGLTVQLNTGQYSTVSANGGVATFTDVPTTNTPTGLPIDHIRVVGPFASILGRGIIPPLDTDVTNEFTIAVDPPEVGSLRVNITDASGNPLDGLEVVLFADESCAFDGGCPVGSLTTVNGTVLFDPVGAGAAGTGVVHVRQYDDPTNPWVYDVVARAVVPTITEGATSVIDLTVAFGDLEVVVTDNGSPAPGLLVLAPGVGYAQTDQNGLAQFIDLPVATEEVQVLTQNLTVLGISALSLTPNTTSTLSIDVDVPTPLPPKSTPTVGATGSITQNPDTGQPTVSMPTGDRSDVTLTFDAACSSGSPSGVSIDIGFGAATFPATLVSGSTYTVTIPSADLANGLVNTMIDCPGGTEGETIAHIVLYDPSGFVTDAETGDPIVGVEVYLYRVPDWSPRTSAADNTTPDTCETNESKPAGAVWSQPAPVVEGILEPALSGFISPAVNPFITDSTGYYGWDVAQGCWYVTIDAEGYEPYVSPVVGVPSEVTDLHIALTPDSESAITGIDPARLTDTRAGAETDDGESAGDGRIDAGSWREIPVAGRAGIPTDATAALLNIVALFPDDRGYLTVAPAPCPADRPTTSSLNYAAGQLIANEVLAAIGDGGAVCVFSRSTTDIVIDVTGYLPSDSPIVPLDGSVRFADTRPDGSSFDGGAQGAGPIEAGSTITVPITERTDDVPDDAKAAVVYVAGIGGDAQGRITVHACLDDVPGTATLNYLPGSVRGNEVIVELDDTGSLCLTSSATAHAVVDVVGYIPGDDTDVNLVDPARIFESRPGNQTVDGVAQGAGILTAGSSTTIPVRGRAGISDNPSSVIVNVVSVAPTSRGRFTLHGCLDPAPSTATLNYVAAELAPNEVLVAVDDDGNICLDSNAVTHAIVDVVAYID